MRKRPRMGVAVAGSLLLHAGVGALLWITAARAEAVPPVQVYRVDIVSPPPRAEGEPQTGAAADPEPVAPVEEPSPPPAPTKEPVAEPAPPAPKPEPAPRPVEPKPVPKPPEPKPAPKPEAKPAESKPTPPRESKAPEPKPAPKPSEPVREAKTTAAERPSTGARPDRSSPGGEDLNVRTAGADFDDPAYLENIHRQVRRYFRKPPQSQTDRAVVRFWIGRDGSVSGIEVVRSSGAFAFRAAAMEAIEQAGLNRAFGPLPAAYSADRLLVEFSFEPDL